MNDAIFGELAMVFAAGAILLWFLVRSLLRYRGWWSSALSGRTERARSGSGL